MSNKFDWDDILITPAVTTTIKSRSTISVYTEEKSLPLIAAPMDTVVNLDNIANFLSNDINVCLPRGTSIKDYTIVAKRYAEVNAKIWYSVSLEEFKQLIEVRETGIQNVEIGNKTLADVSKELIQEYPKYVLIDIANGHIDELCNVIKKAKTLFDGYINEGMKIMAGNIANPLTYTKLSEAGADYIRLGIGNGNGCLSTVQLGIGYPMASLVSECIAIKNYLIVNNQHAAKIVADGGMKSYSDIIKALALGADLVMVGSVFNKSIESSGFNYFKGFKIPASLALKLFNLGCTIKKKFRGMSTKEVQKAWGKETLKTSEGIVTFRKVEYTLESWTNNFRDYLASAMSYTNCYSLTEFIGKVTYTQITQAAFNRFKK